MVSTCPTLPDGLHRLALADGRAAVAKIRRGAPDGFFAAEARGLEALRATRTIRVVAIHEAAADGLVLEDLGAGHARDEDWTRAGARLAALHRSRGPAFGFDADGWCGDGAQDNRWHDDGHAFFAERRLRAQAERAATSGRLGADDLRRVERIAATLADRVPPMPPVLIHGDLWLGNLHACANGELALIDGGAVHYGWAEAELAMLTLFGEPPPRFFAAYAAEAGIDASWRERASLYNLYHLLNHLNLFGAGYLGAVRRALDRWA
ncbi:MAG TPA: fructosamine kinase family protein [Dokdonella sp.]